MSRGLSDSFGRTRLKDARRIVLLAGLVVFASFAMFDVLGIRINSSPSLPLGLYAAGMDAQMDLIEFCPAEPFASFAIIRGYRDGGNCFDGAAPLLKPVVAHPGDVVELSERGIAVNGELLPKTGPLDRDSKGRRLQHWPFGRYRVSAGTFWVASSYNARSFDSRYFGPVDQRLIRDHFRPLLTQ
jgi:conjugative transfer signal peptidase TraF